jgi:hypothetical protein
VAKKKVDAPASKPKNAPAAKAAKEGNNGAKPATERKSAAAKRALTSEEIGLVAGDVWRALSESGGQSVATLKKSVGAPDELVLAALGWLAREEKLAFETNRRSVTVSLQ